MSATILDGLLAFGPPPPPFDPVVITPGVVTVGTTTATVPFSVAPGAQAQVEYGPDTGYGFLTTLETQFLTDHIQTVPGLTPGNSYHARIKAISATGIAYYGPDFTIATLPVISNVSVAGLTSTSVRVTWDVSPTANGLVEYGTVASGLFGSTTSTEASATSHTRDITGLTAGVAYHFRAKSTGGNGATATSSEVLFTSGSGGFPADTTLILATQPTTTMPTYRGSVAGDVVNGSGGGRVARISNTSGITIGYPTRQPENSDGTRVLLERVYPGRLLRTDTYADLGPVAWGNPRWSNTEPDVMYGTQANRLVKWNPSLNNYPGTTVHTFSGLASGITIGGAEGAQSDDDKYWPILSVDKKTVIIYNLVTNTESAPLVFAGALDNAKMAHSGLYFTAAHPSSPNGSGTGTTQGAWIYLTSTLARLVQTTKGSGFHGDWALAADGSDVYCACDTDGQCKVWTTAGAVTQLFSGSNAYQRSHLSGRSLRRGWILLCNYDGVAGGAMSSRKGWHQIVWAKLDGSGTVQVVAFDHSDNNGYDSSGPGGYATNVFAVPNRTGDRVYFTSDWMTGGAAWYCFVAGQALPI